MISRNQRITYNSVILYIKLILSIIIGLYSSRLILQALGNSDFGLYTVVGGIVTLLNVVGTTMSSVSYRFISVEIGKGKLGNPNLVYNTILTIHIITALLVIVVGLSLGLWYVNNYLNVDVGKISDANYVFIVSIITTAFGILASPSNGLIIAREKFLFTSLIEIFQLILKLSLLYFILIPYQGNSLRLYANMMACITIIAPISYTIYCKVHEPVITRWNLNLNWKNYKEVFSFMGWLLLSTFGFMGVSQGGTIILNLFFGTLINAGFGIALQVQNYLLMFPKNIIQAASPQIMKSYSSGDKEHALSLVYLCTKYCFFTFYLLSVPCLLFIDEILQLWLGTIPPYASIFTSYLIINAVIGSLTNGLDPLVLAVGKIKLMQIGYLVTNLIQLPIMYVAYYFGAPAYSNTVILLIMTFISIIYQLYIARIVSDLKIQDYIRHTIRPIIKVILLTFPLFFLRYYIDNISTYNFVIYIVPTVLWIGGIIFFAGISYREREFLKTLTLHYIKKDNRP